MAKITIHDVQLEHYTPDPSRGAARTSKRFKTSPQLKIWTDERTIFIEAERETIAVPYERAVWIRRDGPAEGEKDSRRGKRASKKKIEPGLQETAVSAANGSARRSEQNEGGSLLETGR